MKYSILTLLFLIGCHSPPCPLPGPDDKPGVYSRELGTVSIDGETCKIYETYKNSSCIMKNGLGYYPYSCDGEFMYCDEKILTRITKCPSGTVGNAITYSSDKFHREQVQ